MIFFIEYPYKNIKPRFWKPLPNLPYLKVRSAIVTAVYKHIIGISSVELNKFNTGEVMNYMSTDTDRVVNFAPSLHAVWSLPFQLIGK